MKTYYEMALDALERIERERAARQRRRKFLIPALCLAVAAAFWGANVLWFSPDPEAVVQSPETAPAPKPSQPSEEFAVGIDGCYAALSLEDQINSADCIYKIQIEAMQDIPSSIEYHKIVQYDAQVLESYRGNALAGSSIPIQVMQPVPPDGVAISTDDEYIPKFETGDIAVVFLLCQDGQEQAFYSISGQAQGVYRLDGANMVCDISANGSYPAEEFFRRITEAPALPPS